MLTVRRLLSLSVGSIMPNQPRKTAAILVIGDEILKGQISDTNSAFIARKLHGIGVQLRRISVVGDNIDDIGEEIVKFSDKYDMVFTTGGVGPTHDDKTYAALATAFQESLVESDEIKRVISQFMPQLGHQVESLLLSRLWMVPTNSRLLHIAGSSYPIVSLRNIIVLPGVPRFCEKAFNGLQAQLFPEARPLFAEMVYTMKDELSISAAIAEVAKRFEGSVEIGSYPVVKHRSFNTKLTVESESVEMGKSAVEEIKSVLGEDIVFYDDRPWVDTAAKMEAYIKRQTDEVFRGRILEAQRIVSDIVKKYKLEEIALSFNGGKDCTVLLHLLRIEVDRAYGPDATIQGFHIMCEDQFPEATQFIIDAAKLYNITVLEFPGPLKTGLELMKKQRPATVAVFMGSRATDPKGRYMLSPTQWTDNDWPQVLRVCPILNWSYSDVWAVLRGLCIPYCTLYDQGYTSLGGRDTTFKNPLLKHSDANGRERYLPAYMLRNDEAERSGRANI